MAEAPRLEAPGVLHVLQLEPHVASLPVGQLAALQQWRLHVQLARGRLPVHGIRSHVDDGGSRARIHRTHDTRNMLVLFEALGTPPEDIRFVVIPCHAPLIVPGPFRLGTSSKLHPQVGKGTCPPIFLLLLPNCPNKCLIIEDDYIHICIQKHKPIT